MKYSCFVLIPVGVRVELEAKDQAEAAQKAAEIVQAKASEIFDRVNPTNVHVDGADLNVQGEGANFKWVAYSDDEPTAICVDIVGDEQFEHTKWFEASKDDPTKYVDMTKGR